MATNQQRRDAAKRKLERRVERDQQRARRRKVSRIGVGVVAVGVLVAGGVGILRLTGNNDTSDTPSVASGAGTMPTTRADGIPATVDCKYDPSPGQDAARPVNPPRIEGIPTSPAVISASMQTSAGPIGLQLDNALSPCTVNSFASLVGQGYYNDTTCHRMTTSPMLKVLQCGDPTGTGTGGPGYQYGNEFPTDQYADGDAAAQQPVIYTRGTVAMANTGQPNSNGSQFFLVYGDSQLPPQYTVFGHIDDDTMSTLDAIADAGTNNANGQGDGAPNTPVQITSIALD